MRVDDVGISPVGAVWSWIASRVAVLGASSPGLSRSRWVLTLVVAALVAAFAGIAPPAPAEAASSEIWSATLAAGSSETGSEGFRTGANAFGSLSDTSFTLGGTTYHISEIYRTANLLILTSDPIVGTTSQNWDICLVVGPQGYSLASGTTGTNSYDWSRSSDELDPLFTDGEDTTVALMMLPAKPLGSPRRRGSAR